MSDKFKKLKKTFILSDSSVNEYGFRLLTSGYLKEKFERNPIGYYMHQRDGGVLLKWDNVRIDGDKIIAEPVINLSHPRGQQTIDEIESGFLNAASVGHIVVIEATDDQSMKLDGQTGITCTKWYHKECSVVDIPGNSNALAQLFDVDDNPINLADFTHKLKIDMDKIELQLNADLIKNLNLSGKPTAGDISTAINNLAAAAAKAVKDLADMTEKFNTEKAETTKAQKEVADLKADAVKKEITDLLDNGFTAGKLTETLQTELAAQYEGNPTGLKKVIDLLPATGSVLPHLASGAKGKDGKDLNDLSWDELDKGGYLPDLKANNYALFEQKYEGKFGKKPTKQ